MAASSFGMVIPMQHFSVSKESTQRDHLKKNFFLAIQ